MTNVTTDKLKTIKELIALGHVQTIADGAGDVITFDHYTTTITEFFD